MLLWDGHVHTGGGHSACPEGSGQTQCAGLMTRGIELYKGKGRRRRERWNRRGVGAGGGRT